MFLNALSSDIVKHVPHMQLHGLTACSSIRMCRFIISMRTIIVGGAALLLQLILLLQHNYMYSFLIIIINIIIYLEFVIPYLDQGVNQKFIISRFHNTVITELIR